VATCSDEAKLKKRIVLAVQGALPSIPLQQVERERHLLELEVPSIFTLYIQNG
jgi:hypothetical protein